MRRSTCSAKPCVRAPPPHSAAEADAPDASCARSSLPQGCIIGKDYPSPIVDHKAAQSVTVEKIKSAYTANLHGADAAVLDGRAGQMLADAYVRIAPATQGKAGGKAGKAEQAGAKRAANPFELAKDNAAKRRKKEAE